MDELRQFYDREYEAGCYEAEEAADKHSFYPVVRSFVEQYDLGNKRCLEIGSGRGAFQDLVKDYVGTDISQSVADNYHKPFVQCSATELPFPDDSFDALWTCAALEHIPDPEQALKEIRRVLRNNGLLLLAPAWQCRPWAADGYSVRPYEDFDLKGKLIKASIPVRNSLLFRSLKVFPRRLARLGHYLWSSDPMQFRYRKLIPNYDRFWMSDSDAVNSMDPFEAILWFRSRRDHCLTYRRLTDQFLVRTGAIAFRIDKRDRS